MVGEGGGSSGMPTDEQQGSDGLVVGSRRDGKEQMGMGHTGPLGASHAETYWPSKP